MFKKFFISLFFSLSLFLVSSCFIRKAMNKEPLSYNYALSLLKDAQTNIKFNFSEHIQEFSNTYNELKIEGSTTSDIFTNVKVICLNIYNACKLVVLLLVDTFSALINILVVVGDLLGFLNYYDIFGKPSGLALKV